MGFTVATGLEENKFSSLTFGRQVTGHTDAMMIHGKMDLTETGEIADVLGSTSSMKNKVFGIGTQYATINLPVAPTVIKQKVDVKFTITGEKRKKIIVRIPMHYDGIVLDDISAVKASFEAMTALSIGAISDVAFVIEGVIR